MARDRIEMVRRLWEAYEQDVDSLLEVADPDVEWMPVAGDGRLLRGHAELREYLTAMQASDREVEATPYAFTKRGDCVIVHGSHRLHDNGGFAESQAYYVYSFRGDSLQKATIHRTEAEAIAEADARSGRD